MIIRNTGSEDLAVYFMGALHDGDLSLWDGSETLNDIVSPGQVTARYVQLQRLLRRAVGRLKMARPALALQERRRGAALQGDVPQRDDR